MLSILPAFSSPDLKVFLLLKKSFKSSAGGQRRDCVIYSVPLSLHSINPTDSPDSRISVGAFADLSVGLCQSRKDPYLPLHPQCVRLLPRPTGLPLWHLPSVSASAVADAKTVVKHHRPERTDGRFRIGAVVTVVPRPTAVHHGYIYIESVRRYSCHFTALLPMCIRLT